MKKSYRILVLLLILAFCLLAGCADAPETIQRDGISYAVKPTEEEVAEESTEGGTQESIIASLEIPTESEYLVETEDGYRCVYTVGTGEDVIVIDADVDTLGPETIAVHRAQGSRDVVNLDAVAEYLFGGASNMVENVESDAEKNSEYQAYLAGELDKTYYDSGNMKPEGGYLQSWDSLEGEEMGLHFSLTWYAGMLFYNHSIVYPENHQEIGMDLVGYPEKEARKDLVEALDAILEEGAEIVSSITFYDDEGNGCYQMSFVPVVAGLAMSEDARDTSTRGYVSVYATAVFGERGFDWLGASGNLLWEDLGEVEGTKGDCLSIGEALALLEYYVEEGKITKATELPLTDVSLCWLPTTEDYVEAELTPVWKFYIPYDEMMMENDYIEVALSEICINAITGELERVR